MMSFSFGEPLKLEVFLHHLFQCKDPYYLPWQPNSSFSCHPSLHSSQPLGPPSEQIFLQEMWQTGHRNTQTQQVTLFILHSRTSKGDRSHLTSSAPGDKHLCKGLTKRVRLRCGHTLGKV